MRVKVIFVALLVILIIIQFFRPEKNISAAPRSAADIAAMYPQPEEVRTILAKACNDCHSNNTRYPWYNNIQPVAWWLNDHIQEGKHELNFNEIGTYPRRRQYNKMKEIQEQVKEGEMPLGSYTLIHTNARLNDHEKTVLINWAASMQKAMEAKYPMDSLIRKKK